MSGIEMVFRVSQQSADLLREAHSKMGAFVTGRRTFDITNGWGGNPPLGVATFVVTHTVPQEWVYEGSPFTFVTEGVENAVEQAKEAAGEKDVAVGAASIAQQCIRAGLIEEIHIDLVPVLLGDGVRHFDNLGTEPIKLESTQVIERAGVAHLTFRVVKCGSNQTGTSRAWETLYSPNLLERYVLRSTPRLMPEGTQSANRYLTGSSSEASAVRRGRCR